MKQIRVEENGGSDVLKLRDVPSLGKPGPGQVLVRLATAGVNFMDVGMRRGTYPVKLPFTPGAEGAGTVEAMGEGVAGLKVNDRVAFTGIPGAYAGEIMAPAERLIPLPDDFSFEQGAAFPLQGMTAHYLIHDFRQLKAGDFVLVHAAAGGMGGLLVQWARRLGATVIGTVSSPDKAKTAREAGAEHVVVYTKDDFVAEVKRVTKDHGADLIIDGVGKSTFTGDLEAVAMHGNIVVFGGASGPADPVSPNALMAKSVTISGGRLQNYTGTRPELMRRAQDVMDGVRQGWLKLNISVFPLAEAAKAHQLMETRATQGKLVLSTAE